MGRRKAPGLSSWLAIAALVLVLDQLSKAWILSRFRLGERLEVIPALFDLTLVYNPGAAFSFLADHDGWQRWFFIGIGIAASSFILWLLAKHPSQRLFAGALSLILGGAIGNWIDRLRFEAVIDFIDLRVWPVFNIADSCITIGTIILAVNILFGKERNASCTR
jgi:signal peptidase II